MNLLVGATGFIGGHLVEYLFQQGEISKGVFRKGSHLKILDANGVQVMEADLLDHHSLHEAMEGVETVYNLASPMPDQDDDFQRVNTEGVLNLLEVATESKVKNFVQLSTLDVHGFGDASVTESTKTNPSNDYQRSKAETERLLEEFSKRTPEPRVVVIRAAKAVGSRDESVVVPILRMLESGKVAVPSGGLMSFIHPKDIAQAMYKSSTSTLSSGKVYSIKSFDATPVELAQGVVFAVGSKAAVKKAGLLSGSALSKYAAQQLKASLRLMGEPPRAEIGYSPQYNLASTCEEIAAWYRKEPWATGTG